MPSFRNIFWGSLLTFVLLAPSLARAADAQAREFEAAEKLFGPYRWGRYDILVLPPSFPFGGMENAKLTFATQVGQGR